MVSLKQEFALVDYLGPLAVASVFAVFVLLISVFLLNFFFISKNEEPTVFEKIASKHNIRFGPHSVESVLGHRNRERNKGQTLPDNNPAPTAAKDSIPANEVQTE